MFKKYRYFNTMAELKSEMESIKKGDDVLTFDVLIPIGYNNNTFTKNILGIGSDFVFSPNKCTVKIRPNDFVPNPKERSHEDWSVRGQYTNTNFDSRTGVGETYVFNEHILKDKQVSDYVEDRVNEVFINKLTFINDVNKNDDLNEYAPGDFLTYGKYSGEKVGGLFFLRSDDGARKNRLPKRNPTEFTSNNVLLMFPSSNSVSKGGNLKISHSLQMKSTKTLMKHKHRKKATHCNKKHIRQKETKRNYGHYRKKKPLSGDHKK
jgi:hypothetical protein